MAFDAVLRAAASELPRDAICLRCRFALPLSCRFIELSLSLLPPLMMMLSPVCCCRCAPAAYTRSSHYFRLAASFTRHADAVSLLAGASYAARRHDAIADFSRGLSDAAAAARRFAAMLL